MCCVESTVFAVPVSGCMARRPNDMRCRRRDDLVLLSTLSTLLQTVVLMDDGEVMSQVDIGAA